jgi:hypothetical protein
MTGFDSKRQAAQAKVQEEMQAVFTKRQAAQDKVNDDDMLTIVYAQGFADGKRSAQRKPLTDEEIKQALTSVDPETKRLPPGIKAFARAIEAAHNIKEQP